MIPRFSDTKNLQRFMALLRALNIGTINVRKKRGVAIARKLGLWRLTQVTESGLINSKMKNITTKKNIVAMIEKREV